MAEQAHQGNRVWTEEEWGAFERAVRVQTARVPDEKLSSLLISACRRVMRTYTSSFFIVSRFLPRAKRNDVEAIYAAVRYPDEVVDTFPLSPQEREARLDAWEAAYATALGASNLRDSLNRGVSVFLAPFVQVVKRYRIPTEYYRAFLQAMRLDIQPRFFQTLDDLIASYIYGSAVVVGYFLTHVYGAVSPDRFGDAMQSARDLGIALQLTNFLRDVAEDRRRGRLYLPLDLLQAEGIRNVEASHAWPEAALRQAVKKLARTAAEYYARSEKQLDAFAEDCRVAIRACMAVYGKLNERILHNDRGWPHRESVPFLEKWRALPASKYWRLPWALLAP